MSRKIAIVTGASSGIGQVTAEQLARAGYKVYGTSRRGTQGQSGKRTFEMLALDVTSDESVAAAVNEILGLGADIVIDYKKEDFSTKLKGYDLVIDTQGGDNLKKSLGVLKPGGKLIGIAGPPDPDFAKLRGAKGFLSLVMRLLSYGIRKAARRSGTSYSFHFMTASGQQLGEITTLIEAGHIRPVVDRIFPFEETKQALDYVGTGCTKGKVVIKVRQQTIAE